jgi:hypothetical protein
MQSKDLIDFTRSESVDFDLNYNADAVNNCKSSPNYCNEDLYKKLNTLEQNLLPNKTFTALLHQAKSFDLEWDKDVDFNHVPESDDASSIYDVNVRMSEILKEKFLEFEMNDESVKSFQMYFKNRQQKQHENGDEDDDFDLESDLEDFNTNDSKNNFTRAKRSKKSNRNRKPKMFTKRSMTSCSNVSSFSTMSSMSDVHTTDITPADCFTLDDLFRIKLLKFENNENNEITYPPITFDIESLYSCCMQQQNFNDKNNQSSSANLLFLDYLFSPMYKNFHRSMPDLRTLTSRTMRIREPCEEKTSAIKLRSKHPSLLDIKSFELNYIKSDDHLKSIPVKIFTEKQQVMNNDQEKQALQSQRKFSMNYSRMSKLEMLRSYMTRIGERIKQILVETFQTIDENVSANMNKSDLKQSNDNQKLLYAINEEEITVNTYDTIDMNDLK